MKQPIESLTGVCDCPECFCCVPVSMLYEICRECKAGRHCDRETGERKVFGLRLGSVRPFLSALTLLISLISLPLYLQGQQLQCQVETGYNRFTNVSTVGTPLDYLTTPIGVLFQSFAHDTHKEANSIKMVLARGGSSFRYLDCHSVIILRDGVRLDLPFDYKLSVHRSGESVSEIWTVAITLGILCELSRATKVEYKICGDEFTVSQPVLCSGGLICNLLKENVK